MLKKSLIILSLLILVTSCNSKKKELSQDSKPVPVLAVKPQIKDIPIYLEAIGVLQASSHVEIFSQVNGVIKEVLVDDGTWVKEEDPLFKIDARPYIVKVKQAQAQLAMNNASYMVAKKKEERHKILAEKNLVSQIEWEEIQAQRAMAQANLEADEAMLEEAELELSYCTIRASIEGRVGQIDCEPGMLVSEGQTTALTTISDMDPLIVEFAVTEKEFKNFPKENTEITLQALCSSEICKNGKIQYIDGHFDPETGLLSVIGEIDNPDYQLRPGQSVRVLVPISIEKEAKLIPQKAVKYNQQGPYIYVVQADGTVGFRQLILGREDGLDVVVKEGLDPAEDVITDGHLRLSPGRKVEVKS